MYVTSNKGMKEFPTLPCRKWPPKEENFLTKDKVTVFFAYNAILSSSGFFGNYYREFILAEV